MSPFVWDASPRQGVKEASPDVDLWRDYLIVRNFWRNSNYFFDCWTPTGTPTEIQLDSTEPQSQIPTSVISSQKSVNSDSHQWSFCSKLYYQHLIQVLRKRYLQSHNLFTKISLWSSWTWFFDLLEVKLERETNSVNWAYLFCRSLCCLLNVGDWSNPLRDSEPDWKVLCTTMEKRNELRDLTMYSDRKVFCCTKLQLKFIVTGQPK